MVATIATAALAAVFAGCGGGSEDGEAGRFVSLGCASCHTLAAADASGRTGPNLDTLKPDTATVVRQLRNGGSGMPSFKDELSDAELRSLAAWVAQVTRNP